LQVVSSENAYKSNELKEYFNKVIPIHFLKKLILSLLQSSLFFSPFFPPFLSVFPVPFFSGYLLASELGPILLSVIGY